jgi:hypothetical protein
MKTKEKIKKLMYKLAIFGFILAGFNLAQIAIYGKDAKAYPEWAALLFVIVQTIIYLDAIIVFILLIRYLSNKEST